MEDVDSHVLEQQREAGPGETIDGTYAKLAPRSPGATGAPSPPITSTSRLSSCVWSGPPCTHSVARSGYDSASPS
jgi:hypothetical protein